MVIAARPGVYPVPFSRLSTGALNVLVFALLTYIADLRGPGSVIFAMEEPEIALPPHTPTGGWSTSSPRRWGRRSSPRTRRTSSSGSPRRRSSSSTAMTPGPRSGVTVAATRRGLTGESSWINLDQSRFTRNTHELP